MTTDERARRRRDLLREREQLRQLRERLSPRRARRRRLEQLHLRTRLNA